MNAVNPVLLSTNGSFERIVNAGTAQRRRKAHIRLNRILLAIVALLALELVNLLLWLFGTIPAAPSIFISEILTCFISFASGRLFEFRSK